MYDDGELDINPDYQRLFRWTQGAQSRFIESLLLEMPVPPIYVVESEEGRYQLIDGLQRFSSYLHLRGKLSASHLDPPIEVGSLLTLQECDIVDDLNNLTYEELPTSLKIRLKRAFVRVEVIRKGSDSKFRYHMFKRLNTGGEALTQQQLRNCTIRMLNPTFIDFVIRKSKLEDFRECIANISRQQTYGAFDQELVLRYFALKNYRQEFVHDVADFLTEYMELVSDPENVDMEFDYKSEERIFDKLFLVLNKSLGAKSFVRSGENGIQSNFSVYHFEGICTGLLSRLEEIDPENKDHIIKIRDKIAEIKSDESFVSVTTGGGKNSPGPLNKRVEIVVDHLRGLSL